MISGAELTLYDEYSNNFSFDLSPTQLMAIGKLLGLNLSNGEMKCYSDESLKLIMSKTIDKWKLEK